MEIRQGYKQSEVGVIPEDWQVSQIGEVCRIFGRIGFRGYTKNDIVGPNKGAITISPSNIQNNKITFEKCVYLSWKKYEESPEIKIFNGDILLVKTGSTFGKTAIVQGLDEKATLNPQIIVLKERQVKDAFLGYVMGFETIQDQISSTIVGGAIPTLSQQIVSKFKFPLPPTKAEQEAIAGALSDVDGLISSLETLITKKRHIKQGAMQELLRPKEGWVFDTVKSLADINTGSKNTQDRIKDGAYPFFVRSQTVERINSCSFNCEAILTAGDGVGTGKVFHYIDGKFDAHQRVYIVSNFSNRLNGYYFFFYFSTHFYDRIMQMTAKSSVDSVRMEMIADMKIPLPPTIEEQTTIATILSDMDDEITTLETKLAKTRQLKQGMTAELLTGRIRLI